MVRCLFIWNLEDTDADDIEVVNRHVELTCVFLVFIFSTHRFKAQMVKFVGQIAFNYVRARLIEYFNTLPEAFRPRNSTFVHDIHLRVESLLFFLKCEQDGIMFVNTLKIFRWIICFSNSSFHWVQVGWSLLALMLVLVLGLINPLAKLRLSLVNSLSHIVEVLLYFFKMGLNALE